MYLCVCAFVTLLPVKSYVNSFAADGFNERRARVSFLYVSERVCIPLLFMCCLWSIILHAISSALDHKLYTRCYNFVVVIFSFLPFYHPKTVFIHHHLLVVVVRLLLMWIICECVSPYLSLTLFLHACAVLAFPNSVFHCSFYLCFSCFVVVFILIDFAIENLAFNQFWGLSSFLFALDSLPHALFASIFSVNILVLFSLNANYSFFGVTFCGNIFGKVPCGWVYCFNLLSVCISSKKKLIRNTLVCLLSAALFNCCWIFMIYFPIMFDTQI